nr:hypothetical protein [Tanacetum cinerariifolium]
MMWCLGCEHGLDCSKGERDNEQCRVLVWAGRFVSGMSYKFKFWELADDVSAAATKDVNAAEPTTLIKMKAEKVRFFNEHMAKRLHDEEVEKAAAREKQEKDDLNKAKGPQQQYDDKPENIDWNVVAEKIQVKHLDSIRKYQSLKRKPVSIAQARKNMIIYLKNMAGYKMEHFIGMNYDKVRPIFKREYNKVQTLFKPDKDEEEPQKKKVDEKTLLQESFKKLKTVKVFGFEVGGITEAYQRFEDMLKGFDREDLVALWRLVKEKCSTSVPIVDKEKDLWVKLKRLFEPDANDVLWKLHRVMTLMLSVKLQVEEDSEMARDLVMKIFMQANKLKRKSLDTSSK